MEFFGKFTPFEIACGTGIALAGMAGAALAYNSMSTAPADLVGYEPVRKPPRLYRQTYKFNTNFLDDDEDEEAKPPGLLILHQLPRGRRTPCIAPFALKLETFLRIHNIKYEVDFESKEPRNVTSPWITLRHEDTVDAQNCFNFICDEYSIDPDAYITEEDRAVSRAFHATLEYHLYWGILLQRYIIDGFDKFRIAQFLPPESQQELYKVREVTEKAAWYHGIGKIHPEKVTEAVLSDLEALSVLLGSKDYFFGEIHPSELDCTAFAMLAQMLWTMDDSPYCKALKYQFSNLKDFCWRMRRMFWQDWDRCLHNIPWDPSTDEEALLV